MSQEICCITKEGKRNGNEWENDDSDFHHFWLSQVVKKWYVYVHNPLKYKSYKI